MHDRESAACRNAARNRHGMTVPIAAADAMARLGTRSKDSRYVPEGTGALSIRHALLLVTCPGFVRFCTTAATRIRDSPTGAVHMEGMESSNKLGSKDVTYGPPLAKSDNFRYFDDVVAGMLFQHCRLVMLWGTCLALLESGFLLAVASTFGVPRASARHRC